MSKQTNNNNEQIKKSSVSLYMNGNHISEIAVKLNCDKLKVYNSVVSESSRITTEEERNKMINLRSENLSYRKISNATNRSAECVRKRIASPAKCHNNKGEYIISDKDLENIKKWYLAGKTLRWIGRKFNMSHLAVKYRLVKCNLYSPEYSKSVPLSPSDKRKITIMHKKGINFSTIVKECGRDKYIISEYIKECKHHKK